MSPFSLLQIYIFFSKKTAYFLKKIFSFHTQKTIYQCGSGLKIYGTKISIINKDKIHFGDNISINDLVYINGQGGIFLGNNVAISAGCMLISTGLDVHARPFNSRHICKEIRIGNNVQIGAGTIILAGVHIGDNVIIGAGSIVTKDIPSDCIAYGTAAEVKRKIL